jgi:uncharacterized protein YijF (DUF1287 family)
MSSRARFVCVIASIALFAGAQARPVDDFEKRLVAAADDRPNHPARYDPGYLKIAYPNGDVPADSGVCTDEIIRIYRAVGIDLQKEVHEDMVATRSAYPFKLKWMQVRLDTNIDHRRVPNLMVFFSRKGTSLPLTQNAADYEPGDIVTWMLPSGRDHIGMVVDRKSLSGRPMVEHNIGEGPKIENVLFDWKITGHYRYRPVIQ